MSSLRCWLMLVFGFASLLASSVARGQGMGGFGGFGNATNLQSETGSQTEPFSNLAGEAIGPDRVLNYITVTGMAEAQVEPEGIRVVFAITSEADTAQACQEALVVQFKAVQKGWIALGIPEKDIVEDFINVLPVFEWQHTERDGEEIWVQRKKAFRMQSNVHISVKTEKDAMAAIKVAFSLGVTEIVTFDYWSSQLGKERSKAMAAALAAAKEKSQTILSVFDAPPKIINIQENTRVILPHSQYKTYTNVIEEELKFPSDYWHNKPYLKAYRPKMSFYAGSESRADVGPTTPAMRPKITVVSSVRIYYQSPADKAAPQVMRGFGQ